MGADPGTQQSRLKEGQDFPIRGRREGTWNRGVSISKGEEAAARTGFLMQQAHLGWAKAESCIRKQDLGSEQ